MAANPAAINREDIDCAGMRSTTERYEFSGHNHTDEGVRTVITAYPRCANTYLGHIEMPAGVEDPCKIVRLFVEESARHQGVAKFLLAQAGWHARKLRCAELSGFIPPASKPTYEAWGAQVECKTEKSITSGSDFEFCIARYKLWPNDDVLKRMIENDQLYQNEKKFV